MCRVQLGYSKRCIDAVIKLWIVIIIFVSNKRQTFLFFQILLFTECTDIKQILERQVLGKKELGFILPAVRFEPGAAGREA